MNRADIYREVRPEEEISTEDIIEYVKTDAPIDPRFLSNHNIPVDPEIVKAKKRQYLDELRRWSHLKE